MPFSKKVGLLFLAVILAVGVNATSLLATKEYASHSTRSQSELTINPDGSPKEISTGLEKGYITEYSFGLMETFDLFILALWEDLTVKSWGKTVIPTGT